MKGNDTTALRAKLLARGQTFTSIANELGVSPQHVRAVAAGLATSAPVSAAIEAALKRKPIAA